MASVVGGAGQSLIFGILVCQALECSAYGAAELGPGRMLGENLIACGLLRGAHAWCDP